MKDLSTKIKDFLDQRQHVLYENHEREYATKKLVEMFEKEYKKRIDKAYKEGYTEGWVSRPA